MAKKRSKTLYILCIDGMDFDEVNRLGLGLDHNNKLTVPEELHLHGRPWTPNVWPSIFTGEIVIHPDTHKMKLWGPRDWMRTQLVKRGITWRRKGFKIYRKHERTGLDMEPRNTAWKKCVDKTVLDNYNSFIFDVPSITDTFAFRGPISNREYWNWFIHFVYLFKNTNIYNVIVLYSHLLDGYAHRMIDYTKLYEKVFQLATDLLDVGHKVMIVSDHGTVDGEHTLFSYLGCSEPINATSVLEVRQDIERIMNDG